MSSTGEGGLGSTSPLVISSTTVPGGQQQQQVPSSTSLLLTGQQSHLLSPASLIMTGLQQQQLPSSSTILIPSSTTAVPQTLGVGGLGLSSSGLSSPGGAVIPVLSQQPARVVAQPAATTTTTTGSSGPTFLSWITHPVEAYGAFQGYRESQERTARGETADEEALKFLSSVYSTDIAVRNLKFSVIKHIRENAMNVERLELAARDAEILMVRAFLNYQSKYSSRGTFPAQYNAAVKYFFKMLYECLVIRSLKELEIDDLYTDAIENKQLDASATRNRKRSNTRSTSKAKGRGYFGTPIGASDLDVSLIELTKLIDAINKIITMEGASLEYPIEAGVGVREHATLPEVKNRDGTDPTKKQYEAMYTNIIKQRIHDEQAERERKATMPISTEELRGRTSSSSAVSSEFTRVAPFPNVASRVVAPYKRAENLAAIPAPTQVGTVLTTAGKIVSTGPFGQIARNIRSAYVGEGETLNGNNSSSAAAASRNSGKRGTKRRVGNISNASGMRSAPLSSSRVPALKYVNEKQRRNQILKQIKEQSSKSTTKSGLRLVNYSSSEDSNSNSEEETNGATSSKSLIKPIATKSSLSSVGVLPRPSRDMHEKVQEAYGQLVAEFDEINTSTTPSERLALDIINRARADAQAMKNGKAVAAPPSGKIGKIYNSLVELFESNLLGGARHSRKNKTQKRKQSRKSCWPKSRKQNNKNQNRKNKTRKH